MKKRIKKKGQIMGQPFIFVLALIVGAIILIFGVARIIDFAKFGCKAKFSEEYVRFENTIQEISYEPPSSATSFRFDVNEADYICFSNKTKPINVAGDTLEKIDPSLVTVIKNFNVVFVPYTLCDTKAVFNFDNIDVAEENPLCIRANEAFVITSKAQNVELSRMQNE